VTAWRSGGEVFAPSAAFTAPSKRWNALKEATMPRSPEEETVAPNVLSDSEIHLIVTSRVPMTEKELKEWQALRNRLSAYVEEGEQ
jgi:hypothetical protein